MALSFWGTQKCFRGGIKHKNLKPKIVDAFKNQVKPERCILGLYEKYLQLCPKTSTRPEAFYLQPLKKPTPELWYCESAIGVNTLAKVVKNMCAEAGLSVFCSNRSLRATAATRLFEKVQEKVVCETTGHRSTAVKKYERRDHKLKIESSNVLQCNSMGNIKSNGTEKFRN